MSRGDVNKVLDHLAAVFSRLGGVDPGGGEVGSRNRWAAKETRHAVEYGWFDDFVFEERPASGLTWDELAWIRGERTVRGPDRAEQIQRGIEKKIVGILVREERERDKSAHAFGKVE